MLFQKKSKAYFVDANEHSTLIARATTWAAPLVVEDIKVCVAGDENALDAALSELQPKRAPSGYIHATCGVYSPKRLIRRATLDPKRYKDATYFNEVVSTQFRIEADTYALAAIDAASGADFDLGNTSRKEALFAGMHVEEVSALQKSLLKTGIYPERLEVGTVSTLGGLIDYLRFSSSTTPTLVLEVGRDSTQSFILSETGVDTSRPIPQGLDAMVPVVQKELGLKDEESARKLFYSNTFDFTGMGGSLIKKLMKELQSSIGFYEVQTGQSIGQVICTLLPAKLGWLQTAIAGQLGVSLLKIDYNAWLKARGITFAGELGSLQVDNQQLGLFSLMLSHVHADAAKKEN